MIQDLIIRNATIQDAPFIATTIIEAEKSGTNRLSYSKVFGVSEEEIKQFLISILEEEIDGCELSLSSFMVAEKKGTVIAALSAWLEGSEDLPSNVIKGNLLSYTLPKACIERAIKYQPMINELHIDYQPNTIQIGAGYVSEEHRGKGILGIINKEIISSLMVNFPEATHINAQIFSCNIPSLRTYEKAGFSITQVKESNHPSIGDFLPSSKKFLLGKEISTQALKELEVVGKNQQTIQDFLIRKKKVSDTISS